MSLAWDASSGLVAGYRVYYGPASASYTNIMPAAPNLITSTAYTIPNLAAGAYYFAVKAFDSQGNESDFSNEVSTTISEESITPPGGGVTNRPPLLPARLFNLSTRTWVGTGDNVMIAGFAIIGSNPKQVLIRALGPTLANAGITNLLYDPTLTLFSGQTVIAGNDNWRDSQETAIQTTGRAPADTREAAILTTLNPGLYTAVVRGVNDTTGNTLVEVFEVGQPESRLVNVSTRGRTETGDSVMIAGFVVRGATRRVLIRALGPTLGAAEVPNPLADPTLTLFSGQSVVASNDNWRDSQAASIQATGQAPTDPDEAAIITRLNPGSYTAIVRGKNDTVGNTLIEVFDLGD